MNMAYATVIEAGNNGTGETWPQAQTDAYLILCRALCGAYLHQRPSRPGPRRMG